jgi:AcrR family transcriptional regulator
MPATIPERRRDAQRTRNDILDVARREFSDRGYDGARVDRIAARMRTTKRMIYYYFGSKEHLFEAVLEQAYSEIRTAEQDVSLDHLDPVTAIRRLAEITFDHHDQYPDFVKLVRIENIHHAEHISRSADIVQANSPAIELVSKILARGHADGVFRRHPDAIDVHMMISSFCVFRVAHQHTFRVLFGRDLTDPALGDRYRTMIGDMVVDYLTAAQGELWALLACPACPIRCLRRHCRPSSWSTALPPARSTTGSGPAGGTRWKAAVTGSC